MSKKKIKRLEASKASRDNLIIELESVIKELSDKIKNDKNMYELEMQRKHQSSGRLDLSVDSNGLENELFNSMRHKKPSQEVEIDAMARKEVAEDAVEMDEVMIGPPEPVSPVLKSITVKANMIDYREIQRNTKRSNSWRALRQLPTDLETADEEHDDL